MQREVEEKSQYAVVAAVQLPSVSDNEFEASLSELRELAKTLGYEVVRTFVQKRSSFDRTAYLGVGKRQEIRSFLNNEPAEFEEIVANPDSRDIDTILVDHEISPSQARNLEKEVGCEVMDRTMVILEIFHRNARSRAARAQVEIARLGYMAPRLREAAKLAGPQGRQRSGVGGRGGGESHTELDRRKIRDRIAELQQEIVAMDVERKTQRARRQERQGFAGVALVGYTNAGKSTLMRALTGSEVLVANKLFATLDTTVRALHPESVPRVLVSDTVGFIKNFRRAGRGPPVPRWDRAPEPGSAPTRGSAAARNRATDPASSSVPGAWCSTLSGVLLGWRTWKSRDPDPVLAGGSRLVSCPRGAAWGTNEKPWARSGPRSWCLLEVGTAACQLPRGGRKSPARGHAIRRDLSPGEHRRALHHVYLR